jgi:hypothetical protein
MSSLHGILAYLPPGTRGILTVIGVVAALVGLTFVLSTLQGARVARNKIHGSKPPTLPYAIPVLGHLPEFLSDTKSFLARAS